MSAAETAIAYLRLGWRPIPIPYKSKIPIGEGWQHLRLEINEIPKYFVGQTNIGILTGTVSKGLVDIDLDTNEAIELAPLFLPSTMRFGRKSRPLSHWLYNSYGSQTHPFATPPKIDGKTVRPNTLLEIRADGRQTIFPSSTHESGEIIEWDSDNSQEYPTEIKAEPLRVCVVKLATATILVRFGWDKDNAVKFANNPNLSITTSLPVEVVDLIYRWNGLEKQRVRRQVAKVIRGNEGEFDAAVDRWNNLNPIDFQRRNSGQCPVCGDRKSFGWLRDNDQKWSCFSTDHPDNVGKRDPGMQCYWGDSLDLESFKTGKTRAEILRDSGELRSAPRTIPASISRHSTPLGSGEPPSGSSREPPHEDCNDDGRPNIVINPEIHDIIDQVADSLVPAKELFQRGCHLVRVVTAVRSPMHFQIFGPTPAIEPATSSTVTEVISKYIKLWIYDGRKKGNKRCIAPSWLTSGLMDRGEWRNIRPLEGLVEVPTIRADGTVLDSPGYDEQTGLIYRPSITFPEIKKEPTRDDAIASVTALLDLVCDFPFAKLEGFPGSYQSAWLSAILTPFVRTSIPTAPMFLVDSNIRGSGKSKLCDIVSIIATGRPMPRTVNPPHDEEFKKLVTSLALAGASLVMIDNVTGQLGSQALDAVITASTWKDRILGKSEMTRDIPLTTIWFATGNNVTLIGDLCRRTIHILLNCDLENPETRSVFKYQDILDHVRRNRALLVAHAITILRAYVLAGSPDQKMRSMDFKEWSSMIRGALIWSGQADPGETQTGLASGDTDGNCLAMMIDAMEAESELGNEMMTTTQMLTLADGKGHDHALLKEAIGELCPSYSGKPVTSQLLGKRLQYLKGRFIKGKCIDHMVSTSKGTWWGIRQARPVK